MAISVLSLLLLVILKKLILWKTNSAKHCKFNGLCFVSKARFSPTAIWLIILWRCAARMFIRNSIALESPALLRKSRRISEEIFFSPTKSRREFLFLPKHANNVKEGKVFPPKRPLRQGGKSFSSQSTPPTSRREKFFLPSAHYVKEGKVFSPKAEDEISEEIYFPPTRFFQHFPYFAKSKLLQTFQQRGKSVFWTGLLSFLTAKFLANLLFTSYDFSTEEICILNRNS